MSLFSTAMVCQIDTRENPKRNQETNTNVGGQNKETRAACLLGTKLLYKKDISHQSDLDRQVSIKVVSVAVAPRSWVQTWPVTLAPSHLPLLLIHSPLFDKKSLN